MTYRKWWKVMDLFPTRDISSALACLMKDPALLEDNKIKLSRQDFIMVGETRFYQIIFAAINNLYTEGLNTISPMNIDEYISNHERMYEIYNQEGGGIDYLYKIEELITNTDAYQRYANRIRKFTLLRTVVERGLPLENIYEESDDTEINSQYQAHFEALTVDDIIRHYEGMVNGIASEYKIGYDAESGIAGENGIELYESFKKAPQYGVSTCGLLQNSVFRGQLLGASMLRSASTNTFKSRTSLAEATDLAISKWFNWKTLQWESRGKPEKVLYITTEMEQFELEPTIWAYISGVKEESIKDSNVTEHEDEIIRESIKHLQETKNFYIEYIPKFDPDTIRAVVKKYAIQHDVDYIFFDYIHLNYEIMQDMASKTRGMNTREDMMLSIFASGLVELSKEYGFHLSTSTQVNGEAVHAKKLDQNVLRGAKSMADKFTKACIMSRPTEEDDKIIDALLQNVKGISERPNMIWHIYKNRHSKFKGKLYLYVDFDTMRMTDLFMTDDRDMLLAVPKRELIVEDTKEEEPLF